MVNNTPIRLVVVDDETSDDDLPLVQDFLPEDNTVPTPVEEVGPAEEAAPTKSTPEHEAITRKVPAVASVGAQIPEWPKPARTWRRYIPLMVALVPVLGLSIAWFLSRPSPVSASGAAIPSPSLQQGTPSPTFAPTPAPPRSPRASQDTAAPEVIRLSITAEPIQAELGLDGNVLAGHRLNLEVPKDRGIHVVSASAPGYIPFNQQVRFADDVVLHISLRRAHGALGRQVSRARPLPAEGRAQVVGRAPPPSPVQAESKPQTKSHPSTPRMEPGMDLDAPATRHGAKSLDERNPYQP